MRNVVEEGKWMAACVNICCALLYILNPSCNTFTALIGGFGYILQVALALLAFKYIGISTNLCQW